MGGGGGKELEVKEGVGGGVRCGGRGRGGCSPVDGVEQLRGQTCDQRWK